MEMSEYRPEGWKEAELADCKECSHYGNDGEINAMCWICHEAYNAGASAMLRALRAKGHHVDGDASFSSLGEHCTLGNVGNTGNYVFLPDDSPEATP